jgi:ABC-type uncharacterized transport system ATPase subunit
MDNLNKFSKDVKSFIGGTPYSYSFNSVGNLFFTEPTEKFNQTFLKIDTFQYEYNTEKFKKMNNIDFEDFKSENSSENSQLTPSNVVQSDSIDELNRKVEELSTLLSSSMVDSDRLSELESDFSSNKSIIIDLRISAGQGKIESDFEDKFPYLPKTS